MGSAKSGPSAASFDKFLTHRQAHMAYGANAQITMTLHNYRSWQVHETLNGVNPSSSFIDMRSAKSGPNLWQIWRVFGPWASPYGANGQMTMTVHTYRPRQFHRTLNGENPLSIISIIWDHGSMTLLAKHTKIIFFCFCLKKFVNGHYVSKLTSSAKEILHPCTTLGRESPGTGRTALAPCSERNLGGCFKTTSEHLWALKSKSS